MRKPARLAALGVATAAAVAAVLALAGSDAPPPAGLDVPSSTAPAPGETSSSGWVGAWATAPAPDPDPLPAVDQSFRMIAHLTAGGSKVRVRLSNRYGTGPVTFGQVRVALRTDGPAVDPATDRPVRFSGQQQVTVAPGSVVHSDPVQLSVAAGDELAVSMHVVDAKAPTRHALAMATRYAAPAGEGDVTQDAAGGAYSLEVTSTYFLTGVDVQGPGLRGAVVALGDSITDGSSSTPNTYGRWPDVLARRLSGHGVGVLNAGISANRVTPVNDGAGRGEPAVERFDTDVLNQSGVFAVILFEGTNDLAAGVPATAVIDGLRTMAARARSAGLIVIGATITPRGCGNGWPGAAEQHRQAVNDWIRRAPEFAAVADLDAATKDKHYPHCLAPRYDSGDGLHPNQLGMRRIAETIPLEPLLK